MQPQAVSRTYAASHCAAFAADLTEDERYIARHIHRCTGEHTERDGLQIHSCECTGTFYFMEDAIELILRKIREREARIEVTAMGSDVREYIDPVGNFYREHGTPPVDHPV